MSSYPSLRDARVLVTGASRGLGRAIAVRFAREGAHVSVGYRVRKDDALETLALVRAAGADGMVVEIDVRDGASVKRAFDDIDGEVPLSVLVNNAAIVRDQPMAMLGSDDWSDVIATNLTGTYHCCRAALGGMMARRRGSIVNVTSLAAIRASPGQANYAASKAGVVGLTRTLAAEAARYGVRVNAALPGLLATGMGSRLDRRVVQQRVAAIPLGRLGEGEEVANAVVFLSSDDASYVTGQTLVVDGGLSL